MNSLRRVSPVSNDFTIFSGAVVTKRFRRREKHRPSHDLNISLNRRKAQKFNILQRQFTKDLEAESNKIVEILPDLKDSNIIDDIFRAFVV